MYIKAPYQGLVHNNDQSEDDIVDSILIIITIISICCQGRMLAFPISY